MRDVCETTKHLGSIESDIQKKGTAILRRRRAQKLGVNGTHTAEDLAEILRLQKHRCAHCRIKFSRAIKKELDHIVALVSGGSNDRRNLQFLCKPCNGSKGKRDAIDFARQSGKLL